MKKQKLLVQLQLSNYDTHGRFILEADSGWQMCIGRIRRMLELNPLLEIDVLGPIIEFDGQTQVVTKPHDINPDIFSDKRVNYVETWIQTNALATRYDFDWVGLSNCLRLAEQRAGTLDRYDAVYVNDPMLMRNFRALFHNVAGYQPRFYVHSHFIDNPSCPKFPKEASLWLGQCEAAIRADHNFWQCESAMNVFFDEMREFYTPTVVKYVREKSTPWDDGYSITEITAAVDHKNLRFDVEKFQSIVRDKTVIFVPNRIGGRGRSSDYTNCGKFMFDILPELRKRRQDFVVIAGNPSQKFSNDELLTECGQNGYVSLVPDAFLRDEFKFIARYSHISLGLYDQDSYGGTAARECVELGSMPLWINNYEYASIAAHAGTTRWLARPDFTDIVDVLDNMMSTRINNPNVINDDVESLRRVVRERCSYEQSTAKAMSLMKLT